MSDEGGQDALYREAAATLGPALARLARSYEADTDKRRDLVQEIHLALWKSFAGFNRECSLRTWAFRVAHNAATTHVIKAKRLQDKHASLEDLENAPGVDGRNVVARRDSLARLYEMIGRLNIVDHAVIVLYLEGEDAAAIADVTGLTAGNVATKVHRIKSLLAQIFEDGERP
jgi:RNA polymerase sigma-70 factor, ECF subfamily